MMRRLRILVIAVGAASLAGCGDSKQPTLRDAEKMNPNKVQQGKNNAITGVPPPPPLPDGSQPK